MLTNLRTVDAQITGGREVEVCEYNIRNRQIHLSLEQVSRLLIWMLECDSNNTSSKNLPSDTRDILQTWDLVKSEFTWAMENNDVPQGIYEYAYKILLISGKEIQRIRNVKIKRAVVEIFNAARVMLSVDSANSQGYIAPEDASKILRIFKVVDSCLARWIGTGVDEKSLGLVASDFVKIGTVVPDVDADYAEILEPSKDLPTPKLPDTQDLPLNATK